MVGQANWRSCALILTGDILPQRRVPCLGYMRSSRFSVIVVWENFRLNYRFLVAVIVGAGAASQSLTRPDQLAPRYEKLLSTLFA